MRDASFCDLYASTEYSRSFRNLSVTGWYSGRKAMCSQYINLPFTPEQFFEVFAVYNTAVWPMQAFLYVAAFAAFLLVFRKRGYSGPAISGILAFYWVWMGVAYHWIFFSPVNPAAKTFGAFFTLQGILIFYEGLIRRRLSFAYINGLKTFSGFVFILFGTVIYPVLGDYLGHVYPYSPTFGLPCPTTILTFGFFLLAIGLPKYLLIIPLIWSAIGSFAALALCVAEDISLMIAGIVTLVLVFTRSEKGEGVNP